MPLGAIAEAYPRPWPARSSSCCRAGSPVRTDWRWAADAYRLVIGTAEHGGYPLMRAPAEILERPARVDAGRDRRVVLSLRGGDFVFESGQDISIGYDSHDADVVRLYLEESFSFRVATPEAAVALTR